MKIINVGNSKGIVLDKTVLETTGFDKETELKFTEIKKGKLVIEKKVGDK